MTVTATKFTPANKAIDGRTDTLYAEASVYVRVPDGSTIDEDKLATLLETLLTDVFSGTVTVGPVPTDPDVITPDNPAVTNEAGGQAIDNT